MTELRTAYPNELYHYGIKGQKWGIRRFQNPDGSLTNAGRKRYSSNGRSLSDLKKKYPKAEEDSDDATNLMLEIMKKSGNWYNGVGVSEGFKKEVEKHEAIRKEINSNLDPRGSFSEYINAHEPERRRYREALAGIILKDLGYKNTKEGRDWLIANGFVEY